MFWTTKLCNLSKQKNKVPQRNEECGAWSERKDSQGCCPEQAVRLPQPRAPRESVWREIWAECSPAWHELGISPLANSLSFWAELAIGGLLQTYCVTCVVLHLPWMGTTEKIGCYKPNLSRLMAAWPGLWEASRLSPNIPQAWPHRHISLQKEHSRKKLFLFFLDSWWQISKGMCLIVLHVCTGLCRKERETETRDKDRDRSKKKGRGRHRERQMER